MTTSDRDLHRALMKRAFKMPRIQKPSSRKSSVTNAFVHAVIPLVVPTIEEIDEVLRILEMDPQDVRCAYCGDRSTTWDHLRPLVLNLRPTGYIHEIANLIPACGTCNSSKRNAHWRQWMLSAAKDSPTARGIGDVAERVDRIQRFEQWREPRRIDFETVVGHDEWQYYWSLHEAIVKQLYDAEPVAKEIYEKVSNASAQDDS